MPRRCVPRRRPRALPIPVRICACWRRRDRHAILIHSGAHAVDIRRGDTRTIKTPHLAAVDTPFC